MACYRPGSDVVTPVGLRRECLSNTKRALQSTRVASGWWQKLSHNRYGIRREVGNIPSWHRQKMIVARIGLRMGLEQTNRASQSDETDPDLSS
jgi:hypothetical protein